MNTFGMYGWHNVQRLVFSHIYIDITFILLALMKKIPGGIVRSYV